MKVTIPEPIAHELYARVEERGGCHPTDDFFGLYNKLMAAASGKRRLDLTKDEVAELKYQCETMIEIAAEDDDPQLDLEAKYAKQLIWKLK